MPGFRGAWCVAVVALAAGLGVLANEIRTHRGTGSKLFRLSWNHDALAAIVTPFVDLYLAEHPERDLTAQLEWTGVLEQTDDDPADVAMYFSENIPAQIELGHLEPLNEYMQTAYPDRKMLISEDIPTQALPDLQLNNQYYALPHTYDARSFRINKTVAARLGLKIPPMVGTGWTQPYSLSWTPKLFAQYVVTAANAGVKYPFWQQECTTLATVGAWAQHYGASILTPQGTCGYRSPNFRQMVDEVLIPIAQATPKSIELWVNLANSPAAQARFRTALADWPATKEMTMFQQTCDIPPTLEFMAQVGGVGPTVATTLPPGTNTFLATFAYTISKKLPQANKDQAWHFMNWFSDFRNMGLVNLTLKYGQFPQYLSALNLPQFQALAASSTSRQQSLAIRQMARPSFYPSQSPPWYPEAETKGLFNRFLLELHPALAIPTDVAIERMCLHTEYLNLRSCRDPTDVAFTLLACTGGGLVAQVRYIWDPAKLDLSCRVGLGSVLASGNITDRTVDCQAWAATSTYGQAIISAAGLMLAGEALIGLAVILARNHGTMKASSWVWSLVYLGGGMVSTLAVFWHFTAIDAAACGAYVWLAALGFYAMIGSLFAKIRRVYLIYSQTKLHVKRDLKDHHLLRYFGPIMAVGIALCVVWSATLSTSTKTSTTVYAGIGPVPYRECNMGQPWALGLIFAYAVILVLVTIVQGFYIINVESQFGENTFLMVLVSIASFVLVIGSMLTTLFATWRAMIVFVDTLILFMNLSMILTYFGPKLYHVKIRMRPEEGATLVGSHYLTSAGKISAPDGAGTRDSGSSPAPQHSVPAKPVVQVRVETVPLTTSRVSWMPSPPSSTAAVSPPGTVSVGRST